MAQQKQGDDEDYKCTLDEASLALAAKELNEVPSDRLSSVNTFRQWILQQKHIKCPTGTEYLLRFLRTAKFSQLRARQILEGYLTMKTQLPHWYNDIDTHKQGIIEFLKSGYCLPLGFNKDGRFLILFKAGVLDTSSKAKYVQNDIWHAMFAFLYHVLSKERAMVNGFSYIMDFTGFEMRHMTYWGMDTIKKSTKMWEGNFPGRFKAFHYYNTGPVFESMMALTMPLLSKKMKDRIHIHSNLEKIYEYFSMEMMPLEYLPDDYNGPHAGTTQEIIDKLVADLTQDDVRERVLYQSSSEWKIDLKQKPDDVPAASFRKLNVE